MNLEYPVNFAEPELKDGQLRYKIYLSNEMDDELTDAFEEWLDPDETVEIDLVFDLPRMLYVAIDSERFRGEEYADKVCMAPENKPLFEAMRAELAAMIKEIDAITYAAG